MEGRFEGDRREVLGENDESILRKRGAVRDEGRERKGREKGKGRGAT